MSSSTSLAALALLLLFLSAALPPRAACTMLPRLFPARALFAPCTSTNTTACASGETCGSSENGIACTAEDAKCQCLNYRGCSIDSDCTADDTFCGVIRTTTVGACMTCELLAQLSDAQRDMLDIGDSCGKTCVAAHHLKHLPAHHLVYGAHRRASVLCDLDRNCATAGHIVLHDDAPMMMATYCRLHAKCARRTALVNSPRMDVPAVRRVPSHSARVAFTAFAARFETRAEETALAFLVRVGF